MNAQDIPSAHAALAIAGIVPDGAAAPVLLFRRAGENYNEDHWCPGAIVSIDDGVTLRFTMPVSNRIDFALLLLPALPGIYAIHRVEIGGEVVADLARRVISANERLEPAGTPQEARYASERGRPTIEIDLRGLGAIPASGTTEVLVAIRREASFAALDRLGDRVADVSAQVRDLASEVGSILLGHGERLYQHKAWIADAHAEVIASVEHGVGRIDAAIADISARAHDRDQSMMRALAEFGQRIERLQTQTDRLVHAVENVFWRRWLRRMRGSRG